MINDIDDRILKLLNERAEIALKVGEVKTRDQNSLCDNSREKEVLERLCAQNSGPLDDENIKSIFQRIMDECLHVQQRKYLSKENDAQNKNSHPKGLDRHARVAFQGERGAFSEDAALKILGDECRPVPCRNFEELFRAIEEEKADYILAPLENSLMGSVHRCYDLLLESDLSILAEIIIPISHYLIANQGAKFEDIKSVESHPVALAQCERFFAGNPQLKRVVAEDTAGSVRNVIESGDLSRAAIAGKRAAEIYKGVCLKAHLEDHRENYTRMVLLGSKTGEFVEGNKISLVFNLPHRPGALHDALRPFVRRGIDLLKIESRPIKGRPWQFNFYLDLQAPPSESELRGALEEIRNQAENLRFLGRYSSVEIAKDE